MCTRAFTKIPCTRGVTTMVLLAVRDFTFGRVCVVGRNPRSSIAQKHSITLHETYCETETQAATKVEVVQEDAWTQVLEHARRRTDRVGSPYAKLLSHSRQA